MADLLGVLIGVLIAFCAVCVVFSIREIILQIKLIRRLLK